MSTIDLKYDKFLYLNTPGGSLINIIVPYNIDLSQFNIFNFDSYLILIKTNRSTKQINEAKQLLDKSIYCHNDRNLVII